MASHVPNSNDAAPAAAPAAAAPAAPAASADTTTSSTNATAAAASTQGPSLQRQMFPDILHEVLACTDEEVSSTIAWLPHGKAFTIKNPQNFEGKVMPRFFGRGKYSSFIRKLNRWGFRQVVAKSSPDSGAFQHELFLRDQPDLARDMSCKKTGSVRGMNHAKRRQNALESLGASLGHGHAMAAATDASALLPDYMLEASLQQRAHQLSVMGRSLATGHGVHPGFAGGYPPPPVPGFPPPHNQAAAAFYAARAYAPHAPHAPPSAAFGGAPLSPAHANHAARAYAPHAPPSAAFGGAPVSPAHANPHQPPHAGALTYEQLMARNYMLESALRDASARPPPMPPQPPAAAVRQVPVAVPPAVYSTHPDAMLPANPPGTTTNNATSRQEEEDPVTS